MTPIMRRLVPLVLALAFLASPAAAITAQEVVTLSKAGVSDEVVLALIERDHTIFTLDPGQVLALQREGLSESIILAMVRSGRGEATASSQSAVVPPLELSAAEPIVVIVGHGPDRPNTSHAFEYGDIVPSLGVSYFPVFVPTRGEGPCRPVAGFRSRSPSTSSLYEASQKFVNSTLLPMLIANGGSDCVQRPPFHSKSRR